VSQQTCAATIIVRIPRECPSLRTRAERLPNESRLPQPAVSKSATSLADVGASLREN